MPEMTKEFLEKEYCDNNKSFQQIATENGCSIGWISKITKKFGIKRKRGIDNYLKLINEKIKFGNLVIIETLYKDKNKHWVVKCLCECGNDLITLGYQLLTGNTKSCGCISRSQDQELYKKYEEIPVKMILSLLRGARLRNLKFEITTDYIWNLFLKQNRKCALTGKEIYFAKTPKEHLEGLTTASLDRINSDLGYVKNNVQWIHKDINKLKLSFNQNKFIQLCLDVAEFQKRMV